MMEWGKREEQRDMGQEDSSLTVRDARGQRAGCTPWWAPTAALLKMVLPFRQRWMCGRTLLPPTHMPHRGRQHRAVLFPLLAPQACPLRERSCSGTLLAVPVMSPRVSAAARRDVYGSRLT